VTKISLYPENLKYEYAHIVENTCAYFSELNHVVRYKKKIM